MRPSTSLRHPTVQGFNLEFEFSENPYFENAVLKKSYAVDGMFEPMEEPTLTNVTGYGRHPHLATVLPAHPR